MATLPKPIKPLNILTIDGGGLQAISTLLILDRLLGAIARNHGVQDSNPRPCDVFDVIAGTGAGGWLALLLGRFQIDVSAALAEWCNLIDCIAPTSKSEQLRMRLMQHSYFDTDRLVKQIDQLVGFYETDKHMFLTPPTGTRCKHVFVSALKTDSKGTHLGYNLFRTYDCPEDSKVLAGPSDPRKYKISHAFAATGAAKYFTPPWKEPSATKPTSRFQDINSPRPHNITKLALNEMWGLYGTDVEISVIVNIGPGIPSASDCRHIVGRFTDPVPPNRGPILDAKEINTNVKAVGSHGHKETEELLHDGPQVSHWVNFNQDPLAAPTSSTERKTPIAPQSTFGSEGDVSIEAKYRRDETNIEDDIRKKLRNVYRESAPPYYHLTPERSAPGTTQNDTFSPKASADAARHYLQLPWVEAGMEELSQRIE